jgi:hypothetical protein
MLPDGQGVQGRQLVSWVALQAAPCQVPAAQLEQAWHCVSCVALQALAAN